MCPLSVLSFYLHNLLLLVFESENQMQNVIAAVQKVNQSTNVSTTTKQRQQLLTKLPSISQLIFKVYILLLFHF